VYESQTDSASDAIKSPALNFFPNREKIGVNTNSGSLKKRVSIVRHSNVNASRLTRFYQVAICVRINRKFQAERQIVEGSKRNNGQRNIGAHQSSSHLSNRPVATCNNDQVGVFLRRFCCSSCQIQLSIDNDFNQRIADRFQAFPDPPVRPWICRAAGRILKQYNLPIPNRLHRRSFAR
jgi:hypothetical protein